jgi:hypothetical protein
MPRKDAPGQACGVYYADLRKGWLTLTPLGPSVIAATNRRLAGAHPQSPLLHGESPAVYASLWRRGERMWFLIIMMSSTGLLNSAVLQGDDTIRATANRRAV